MSEDISIPRGRHAPSLEVRQDRQRQRLFASAATIFARQGYAEATAEAIAREAGMSKATFYEHFDNKEDCICALFDVATEAVLNQMRAARDSQPDITPRERYRATTLRLLEAVAAFPDATQTLLVEIVGAGPRAMERRDRVLAEFVTYIEEANAADADAGRVGRLASQHDAVAVVGAVVELVSRQIRTGVPADIRDLAPVVERLIAGVLAAAEHDASAA